MRKGIIATILAVLCVMIAATYAFAAPKTEEKKAEATKEATTTTEKEKTTTETKKEVKKENPAPTTAEKKETTTAKKERTTVVNDQEELDETDSTDDAEEKDDLDELDDEKIDSCDHDWKEASYAYDDERGYVLEETCSKCNLIRFTPVSEEEYEAATQEPESDDCTYEDSEDAEVVE